MEIQKVQRKHGDLQVESILSFASTRLRVVPFWQDCQIASAKAALVRSIISLLFHVHYSVHTMARRGPQTATYGTVRCGAVRYLMNMLPHRCCSLQPGSSTTSSQVSAFWALISPFPFRGITCSACLSTRHLLTLPSVHWILTKLFDSTGSDPTTCPTLQGLCLRHDE